ncbi:MAG TPA: ATP-binding protein [Ginsengibacter sp.]
MKSKIKVVSQSNQKLPALNKIEKLSKQITTKKTWKNLNVDRTVKHQLNSINDLIPKHNTQNMIRGAKDDASVGYKILFSGSVKGKKLAAKLIGKENSLDVHRIDTPSLVSKYIGETEKNLEHLFETAQQKNWILFFDEADALFGKRSSVSDAHDRYANQDISPLLQRINEYPGLVIFSTKNNDDSNTENPIRLNTVINFKEPS